MRWILPVLLVLASCADGPPPTSTTTDRPLARRLEDPNLPNFAQVNDRLYRGGQPTAEGYRKLGERGVKTVVNLRSHHAYRRDVEAAGLKYVELPLRADLIDSDPPTDDELKRFFDIVLDPARQPVFIHCMGGKDRTGTLMAVYRMEIDGWTREEAIEEMQAFGFHDYYDDLMEYVQKYKLRGFSNSK
jgi:tyrosine-protein phosphatase SIW14